MVTATINLTERDHAAVQRVARELGKTEAEVLQQAIDEFLAHFDAAQRRAWLEQAAGMWRDRDDLSDFEALRHELDRSVIVPY